MKTFKVTTLTTFALAALTLSASASEPTAQGQPVTQNQLAIEMAACDLADGDKKQLYSRCLQLNHPRYHDGNYDRWNARGEICTTFVTEREAPVLYFSKEVTEAEALIKSSRCFDDSEGAAGAGSTEHLVTPLQLKEEMKSCGFMDDIAKMYTRCLQVNHPRNHGWTYDRWNARGTICSTFVKANRAPVVFNNAFTKEADWRLEKECLVTEFVPCECDSETGKLTGTCTAEQRNKESMCGYIFLYGYEGSAYKTAAENNKKTLDKYGISTL